MVFVCTTRKTYLLGLLCTSYFDQGLLLEVTCQNQKRFIAVIYYSPSRSQHEIEDFLFNLEKIINQNKHFKLSITITFGDFNAGSSDWWPVHISSPEDTNKIF